MSSSQELRDLRAVQLNIIDDILRSATEAGRPLSDVERASHDAAVALVEGDSGFDAQIARADVEAGDVSRFGAAEIRRARYDVPNIAVRGHASVKGDRNLNELLWATSDVVRADNGISANPVEQVIVRSDTNDAGVLAPRISVFRPEDREVVRSFQATVADMALFGMLVDPQARTSKQGFEVARSHRLYKDQYNSILRALDVDTAAEGTEWVPTGIGANVQEKVRASGKVAPLFQRINLPTSPWKWPLEGADATAYRVAEPTADNATAMTASTPGTGAATFDAEIFGARTLFSKTLDANSAVAVLPYLQRKLVQSFVDAEEKAILAGDTDGTHMDSDTNTAGTTDARWAWDGLRKKGIAQTVVTNTTCTVAKLLILRAGMGKWGVNPADLAYIIGVSNYHTLLGDTNLLTVDKMGPNAVILSGQVGSVAGVPVIVSEHVREDLNVSGVYDAITTTKTHMLCVNRNAWAMGQRMALDIKVDDVLYMQTFQRVVVAFMLEDFQHIGSAATDEDTAISYNVTP